MDVNDPTNADLPQGFLIRDKSGHFKKVEDGQIVDIAVPPAPAAMGQPAPVAPLPKAPVPPALPVSPVPQPRVQPEAIVPRSIIAAAVPSPAQAPLDLEREDQEEIERHARDLEAMGSVPQLTATVALNAAIEQILHESGVTFTDDLLAKRFLKIIESRLRDIRSSIETREVLTRPKKIGGIELSPEQADRILQLAEERATAFHSAGVVISEPRPSAESDRAGFKKWGVDLVGQGGMYAPTPPPFVPKPGEIKKELPKPFVPAAQPVTLEPVQPPQPVVSPVPERPAPIVPPPAEAPAQSVPVVTVAAAPAPHPIEPVSAEATSLYARSPEELPKRTPIPSSIEQNRPQMVDIRQPMHVVGPVEEISEIDLKEFRRLGTNPQESAEKVLEKIDLLEEDSYQRRSEGVSAWKSAPIFKLYIDIGRESIDANHSVEQTLQTRTQGGQPALLMEEFLAINTLNSSLSL